MGRRTKRQEIDLSPVDSGLDGGRRTIYFVGEINDESVARALVALDIFHHSDGPVRIVLCSAGGDVDAGMTLYDAIRGNHNPVIIDVVGTCQSMAALILQAGSLRRASPESRLMVHPGRAGVDGLAPAALAEVAREIERGHRRYCELLAERCGRPLPEVEGWCSRETYLSVQEALDRNLLDGVTSTFNPMRVRVRRVRRK